MTTEENDRVHIEFQVSTPDGRRIAFQGDVPTVGIKDWFERAALGVSNIFGQNGPMSIHVSDGGPNKINSIKKVREITSTGLKEAKDIVEGTRNIRCDAETAKRLINELSHLQCRAVGVPRASNDYEQGQSGWAATSRPLMTGGMVADTHAGASVEVTESVEGLFAKKYREVMGLE